MTFRRFAPLIPIALVLAVLAVGWKLRRPERSSVPAAAPTPAPESREEVKGTFEMRGETAATVAREDLPVLAEFRSAKARRDWPAVTRLKKQCRTLPPSTIRDWLPRLGSVEQILRFAGLMEESYSDLADAALRAEIADKVKAVLEKMKLEDLEGAERSDYLRFLAVYGGSWGESALAGLVQNDPRHEVKMPAALALACCRSDSARAFLQARADGPFGETSGVYAIMALDLIRKRTPAFFPEETVARWTARLEKVVETVPPERVEAIDAVGTLASFRDTDMSAVLIGLVQRPEGSETLKKNALHLLGWYGTAEDLEKLPSVPPSLQPDLDAARREIRSHERDE